MGLLWPPERRKAPTLKSCLVKTITSPLSYQLNRLRMRKKEVKAKKAAARREARRKGKRRSKMSTIKTTSFSFLYICTRAICEITVCTLEISELFNSQRRFVCYLFVRIELSRLIQKKCDRTVRCFHVFVLLKKLSKC